MSARTKARKRAVDALFAADLRDLMPGDLLEQALSVSDDANAQQEIFDYAREIVNGVTAKLATIDDELSTYAQGWTLARMPALDRAILRMSTWELLFNDQVPNAVAIDEAVEIAKEYSTDNSAGFVNGVLGKIAATQTAL